MVNLRNIFRQYPNIMQLAYRLMAGVPLSMRLGKDFWKWYAFYTESENWTIQELEEYQLACLRTLLSELIAKSKYYQGIFEPNIVNKIYSLDDFSSLIPTISRLDYKNHYDEILSADTHSRNVVKSQTSGTTGMALQFFHTVEDQDREWASICYQWRRVGYHPGNSRRAEFRGLTSPGKLVDIYPHHNMIRCSILNLKPEHIRVYSDEIINNQIEFLHGYPSALYLLASELLNSKIIFPQPKAILLASEIVYDWQVARIQEAFPNTKIFAHYGCAERTVLAGWCENRREYHILPQYSIVEIDQETSEVIGTNLYNSINGFIRYRMTDTVLAREIESCPDCHRPYTPRLVELGGRSEDYLYSPQNGWIPPAIVTYPLKSLKAVRELQFYQKNIDEISVRYSVLSQGLDLIIQDLNQIKSGLIYLVGCDMKINFEYVVSFEKGPSGKFKWIISELDKNIC